LTSKLAVLIGGVAVAAIALFLWPIFSEGEPWLSWALALFVLGGGGLVIGAIWTRRRAFRYALLGIPIGFLIGGPAMFFLVRGGSSNDGWEALAAVAAGILGAFVGAILGGAIGAAIGASRDRAAERAASGG
jgi:uncharacterized membrane protein